MAVNNKQMQKIAMFGGLAGLATPLLLKYLVMPILNFLGGFIPQVSLKLANPGTISLNVRESLTGLNLGLPAYVSDLFGLTINIPGMTYIMAALGGAVLFVAGAYIADALGMLKGNAVAKTRTTIFAGNIVAGLILGWSTMGAPQLGLELVNVLVAFIVNAAVLAFAYVAIDKQFKLGLIPF